MKKTGIVLGLCILMVCTFSIRAWADSKKIEIGALYPRSGSLALLGEESWRGAEIARQERNKRGGIAGREIVFVEGDCSDVAAARSEAERLIEQKKVGAIIGSYSSSRSMAATEVAARKNVLYFELGAIANDITNRGYQTIWRTNPTAQDFSLSQVDFITNWVAPQMGKAPADIRVSIAHEDSDYGTSVAASFKELAETVGIKVVSIEPYAATSSDLSSVIFRLRKAEPDLIIAVSYAQDAILLSRQAYEFKLKTPFFGTGGGHSLKSFQEALGNETEGVLNVDFTQYEVDQSFTPGLQEFLALYKEIFKEEPKSGHSLANYMGAKVVFDILEKTGGSFDPGKVREVAMAVDIKAGSTATGWGVKFDDKGQNVRAKPLITEWRGGKLVTVWPEGAALMPPVLPK